MSTGERTGLRGFAKRPNYVLQNEKVSRFQLLRGGFRATSFAVRAPFALSEDQFTETCTRQGACIKACPENIVVRGTGTFPELDFARGECTFCFDCVEACGSGALSKETLAQWRTDPTTASPLPYKAAIGEGCLSSNGVTCRICGDTCETRAIKFQLAVGGKAFPSVDTSACNGCGACQALCPVHVISFTVSENSDHLTQREEEA